MTGSTRYQGAIIRDHHILLIKHHEHGSGRAYWIFPGGGIEPGEKELDCVQREMKEETNLDVRVVSLLLDEPADGRLRKQWMKTYLCEPVAGEPSPGVEPEVEASRYYSIVEVRWFDLRDKASWVNELVTDPFTYPLLQRVRKCLGYLSH